MSNATLDFRHDADTISPLRQFVIMNSVESVMREWPLCDSYQSSLHSHPIAGGFWIGYRTGEENIPFGTTHFDLNIIGKTCYLLHIELAKEHRGQGYGAKLYDVIEKIAKGCGCDRVQQTPSGWTYNGEPRLNYLLRRGWQLIPNSIEVYKEWR